MISEERAMAEIDMTMTPRLAGVRSMAAPIGVCSARPMRPLIVATMPNSVWLQWRSVTR